VSDKGVLGAEHAFGLPMDVSSPLFAVAGSATSSPGDTVLVGWLGPDPTGKKGDLSMIALPADGTPPMGPAAVIHEFPGGIPSSDTVVMQSSRKGNNAGLAWVDPVVGQVLFASVNAQGALVGAPTPTTSSNQSSATSGPYACLSFQPGKDDLTLVYHAALQTSDGWAIVEASEDGGVDSYATLGYYQPYTSCAVIAPTSAGYGIAWQDNSGAWFGSYVAGATTLPSPVTFASSSDFGGAYLQPPLVALASFQPDFGVLFKKLHDAELWRLDQMGNRRSGALILPSAQGNLGDVSTTLAASGVAVGAAPLAITYADYTGTTAGPDGGTTQTGNRVFLNAACY
jgi:hypothetical protein